MTDADIRTAILTTLTAPLAGEHGHAALRDSVSGICRDCRIQTRRVARVADTMAREGTISVRMEPSKFWAIPTPIYSARA